MVPIHDANPTLRPPIVTRWLIIVNVICFLIEIGVARSTANVEPFFYTWAFVPCQLFGDVCSVDLPASPFPEWITLITSQFLHGGIGHIFGNMLYLWIFGNNVEDCLGHTKFLLFYLACGALAALSQGILDPGSSIAVLGASGAIAGVLGAYILRFPRAKIMTLIPIGILIPVRIPAFYFLGFWFVTQLFNGVASFNARIATGGDMGGVAYWAHAGGFIFGMILGPLLGLYSTPSRR